MPLQDAPLSGPPSGQPPHPVAPLSAPSPSPLHPEAPASLYDDTMELAGYTHMLAASRWVILVSTLLCCTLGVLYALLASPVYEATMLIHVEEDKPNNSKNMIGEISALFDVKAAAISEMELLKSRMVIAKAVDTLGLYVDAHPVYLPLVGRALARWNGGLYTPGIFGYGGYVWGDEKIDIAEFYVSPALQGVTFDVIMLESGRYRLQQQHFGVDLMGNVDTLMTANLPQGRLALRVNRLDALPGARFQLRYVAKLDAIERVQRAMTVAEIGKQSGLISVTLEAPNASSAHNVLNEIGREYLRQNVARKLEEAEKSLAFLDRQLPDIKERLDRSEAEYYRFRHGSGTIDLAEETKLALQQTAAAKARRLELQQKRHELLASFTPEHPALQAVDRQLAAVSAEISRAESHIRQLPSLERDLLHLSREVKINTDLYSTLLNSAQQLRLVKAGKVSNVRLVDPPMLPLDPARPDRGKIVALATIGGLLLGLALAALRSLLYKGIDHPARIERMLGARVVYASIPHSAAQHNVQKSWPGPNGMPNLLACIAPSDPAIECLRTFRTALLCNMGRFRNNIIQVSGATDHLGKSFVTANLAAVLAMSGKHVLLVDADLRHGQLHLCFKRPRENGLCEAIAGLVTPHQAVHPNQLPGLDFMATGNLPPNPSEFLLHPHFATLLQTLAPQYDYVLIDAPALLNVSDGLVSASQAGAVFLLARAGVTTEDDINESIKRLHHAGISPQGVLFNDQKLRARQLDHYPPLLAQAS